MDGTEWALKHLGELKMPLLVLHGVEDQMVLVSGSRWQSAILVTSIQICSGKMFVFFFRELVKRARSRDKKLTMIPVRWHKHHLTFFYFDNLQVFFTGSQPSCTVGPAKTSREHLDRLGSSEELNKVKNILKYWVLQRGWTSFWCSRI